MDIRSLFLISCLFVIGCESETPTRDTSPLAEVESMLNRSDKAISRSVKPKADQKRKAAVKPPSATLKQSKQVLAAFPPIVGKRYPNLQLFDSSGRIVSLASLRGRPLLIEPIGMNCAACQAFSGGGRYGGFGGVTPQAGLPSFDELLAKYARVQFSNSDILLVQIIFYNSKMQAPTPADIRAWERHFRLRRSNIKVLGATEDVRRAAQSLIPGFQLIDRNFMLKLDATGHRPTHDLYRDLLPALR